MFRKRKLEKIVLLMVAALMSVFVIGCTQEAPPPTTDGAKPAPETPKKVYTIRYNHGLPTQHYVAAAQASWAEKAEAKSNGQLKFEIYPSAQLYSDRDLFEALATGAVEGGGLYSYILAPAVPVFEIYSVPGCADSLEQVHGILEGPIRQKLFAALEQKGLKPVFVIPWCCGGIYGGYAGTGKMIITPDDQKGKKVRAISKPHTKIIGAGGGQGVYLSGAELYTGMQRGTLDTLSVSPAHLIERKLAEVSEWYTGNIPVGADMMSVVCMNKKYFDGLPADVQKALLDAGEEVYQAVKNAGAELNEKYVGMLKEQEGFEVRILSAAERAPWLDVVSPIVKEYFIALGGAPVEVYNLCQAQNEKLGIPSFPIE